MAPRKPRNVPALAAVAVTLVIVSGWLLNRGGASRRAEPPDAAPVAIEGSAGGETDGAGASNVGTGPVSGTATRVKVRAFAEGDRNTVARGAQVWVDGKPLASAPPITLDLPPGPHSIRVSRGGEDSPVRLIHTPSPRAQVVDFRFGTGDHQPRLTALALATPSMFDRVATLSVFMDGADDGSVKDIWLDLKNEGVWHRYPMSVLPAPGGTVGIAVLPAELLRASAAASYFATVTLKQSGDQYFTEITTPDHR